MVRILIQPGTLFLLAANLTPLIGVIFWGWDAFLLLMLYWLETAIIAFWTIVRIALTPRDNLGGMKFQGSDRPGAPLGLALFFTIHAGIFMTVHFIFLWALFSGGWSRQVHGIGDFVDKIIIESGLWMPLLALFVVRGALMMFETAEPWLRRSFRLAPRRAGQDDSEISAAEGLLLGLYARIFVMQATILIGAWFALLIGTPGAYALLIAVKSAIDIALQAGSKAIHAAWFKAKAEANSAAPD